MKSIIAALKKAFTALTPTIVKDEPAIAAAVVGIAVNLGTDLGLSLTSTEQGWIAAGTIALIGLVVRAVVTPAAHVVAKHPRRKKAVPHK